MGLFANKSTAELLQALCGRVLAGDDAPGGQDKLGELMEAVHRNAVTKGLDAERF